MKITPFILAAASGLLLTACSAEVTEEGEMPEMDVEVSGDAGNLPEVDVDTADVEVGTDTVEVEVPDVDVEMPAEEAAE